MSDGGMLTHVAVIDGEPLLRGAWEKLLRSFTSCWVAGSFGSFDDLYIRSNGYPYDAFLLRMADTWPINWSCLRSLRAHKPDTGVVVILSNDAVRFVPAAIQNGARAVVSTAADPQELQDAILAAACNKSYLCRIAAAAFRACADEEEKRSTLDDLSSRESDVLTLTAHGMRLKEIAEQLGVNIKSAYSYRVRAMQKLGLQNTAQVIRYIIEKEIRDEAGHTRVAVPAAHVPGLSAIEED